MRCLVLLTINVFAAVTSAQADLEWRVSVKFILNESGHRAPSGDFFTDEQVYDSFARANARLGGYARGYHCRVVEIVDIPGHAEWFDDPIDGDTNRDLRVAALFDPQGYRWSDTAINIYVLGTGYDGSDGSGIAGDLVLLGQNHEDDDTPFHECCHHLGLLHTHGTPGRICSCGDEGCDPGCDIDGAGPDDLVSDTLRDHNCWDTSDEIACPNFDRSYNELNAAERRLVDDTLNNLMGYHDTREVLTPGQLDRLTDWSNRDRANITNGKTWFVDWTSQVPLPDGSSTAPLPTLAEGLDAAEHDDVILLRAGRYAEQLTIARPLLLTASRGNAVIGE